MNEPPDVVLLRSADEPDRYLNAFEEAGLRAVCEPVLTFAFPNQPALGERLDEAERYAGLIATSPRVADALDQVFADRQELAQSWRNALAYAVGPKTAERLRAVGLAPRGAEAGDAAALADRVIDDAPQAPLLFLCGNRRRETLPDRLEGAGVSFDELVVYETQLRDRIDVPSSDRFEGWLVFFSPSGLEAVRRADSVDPESIRDCQIAAIGPTTGGALEEAGLSVEAVAEKPSPTALVTAITAAQAET